MFSKVIKLKLFAKLFAFGLLLLFIDVFKNFALWLADKNSSVFDSIPFLAAGIVVCLVSLLFLLINWLSLPFGTQVKRVKLYQGAGNLLALTMLLGGCFIKNSPPNFVGTAALILSFSGLIVALVFNWFGELIADFLSRKKIKVEPPIAESAAEHTADADAPMFGKQISSKVSRNSITQH